MYFLKKNRYKIISKVLLFSLILEPFLLLGFARPAVAQTNANNNQSFNQAFSSYDGISQWGNLDIINNPAIGSALRSCLQVVPSFTRKIKRVFGSGSSAATSSTIGSSIRSGNFDLCQVLNEDKWGYGSALGDDGRFGGYVSPEAQQACEEQRDEESGLADKLAQSQQGSSETVPVEDKTAIDKLDKLEKQNKDILAKLNSVNTETTKTNKNLDEVKVREECMDSIAYSMTKTLLAGVTEGTVNLINEGNFGDPFYIKDTKKYFEDIDKLSLKQVFGSLVDSIDTNSADFPFLRSTYKNLVEQNIPVPFRDRARFTLEQVLSGQPYNAANDPALRTTSSGQGSLVEAFKRDFSVGGWEGWLALTQSPQNNPIGFAILAQEELVKNQTAAKEQAKSELDQNGGLLSMKRCTEEYVPATFDDNGKYIEGYIRTRGIKVGPNDPNCRASEVTTPGRVLAARLDSVITSDVRQLELADRFNESLNLIFTSAFNKLTSEGLSALSSKTYGSWASQTRKQSFIQRYNSTLNQVGGTNANNSRDVEIIYRRPTSSFSTYDFDITTDLFDQQIGCTVVPGVLTNEKNYLAELQNSNNVRQSPLYKLMPAMAELDFCVPGPTTNWEDLADEKYADVVAGISTNGIGFDAFSTSGYDDVVKKQVEKIEKDAELRNLGYKSTQVSIMAAGAYFASVTYGISAAVAGIVNGIIEISKRRQDKKDQEEIRNLNEASGLLRDATEYSFEREGFEWATYQLENLKSDYTKYKEAVYDKFSDANSIPVAKVARPFIQDLSIYGENLLSIQNSYNEEIKQTKERITELQSIYDSVKTIKDNATKRAKDQGISLELPKECKPAANQCPNVVKVGKYLITVDPTGYPPIGGNSSAYTADPAILAGAIGSASGANPNSGGIYGQYYGSSTAGGAQVSGTGINGYKFGDPSVTVSNFFGAPLFSSSGYTIVFNLSTNSDTISVILNAPFANNVELYGTSQYSTQAFGSSNLIGKKVTLTASNPNAKTVQYSCTIKQSGIGLACE